MIKVPSPPGVNKVNCEKEFKVKAKSLMLKKEFKFKEAFVECTRKGYGKMKQSFFIFIFLIKIENLLA